MGKEGLKCSELRKELSLFSQSALTTVKGHSTSSGYVLKETNEFCLVLQRHTPSREGPGCIYQVHKNNFLQPLVKGKI